MINEVEISLIPHYTLKLATQLCVLYTVKCWVVELYKLSKQVWRKEKPMYLMGKSWTEINITSPLVLKIAGLWVLIIVSIAFAVVATTYMQIQKNE